MAARRNPNRRGRLPGPPSAQTIGPRYGWLVRPCLAQARQFRHVHYRPPRRGRHTTAGHIEVVVSAGIAQPGDLVGKAGCKLVAWGCWRPIVVLSHAAPDG